MENMIRRLIGEDIEFITNLTPDLWKVHADSGQMEQVIMNMVVNSRDAMPLGGKIIIKTANVELGRDDFNDHGVSPQAGPYAMLSVIDNGVGMDEEIRSRIFEPFFTTKDRGSGTGLGLSTVYGIVKQSNGYVWVYSEPGHGTAFKIYFPRMKEKGVPEEKEQTPVGNLDGSETILIVEDDERLRFLAKKILQRHGYKILEFESGDEALEAIKAYEGPIHLLITDVVMPGMSGKETAENLQTLLPDVRVIYMSGYLDDTIVRHGILSPGVNFLEKPFSPKGLAGIVRKVLNQGIDD
jgi:CheY-like chemotaxis protein